MKMAMVVLAALVGWSSVHADDDERRGLEIALGMDKVESGYRDYTAKVIMRLYNRAGQESVRELRFKTLETPNDGDKSIVVFDRPKDVEGFAALTHAHKQGADDQWMYMPELRRVKRIASVNQAGPFVGSEFAYEDIGSQEPEQYTYRYGGEESLDGRLGLVIERYPVDENSGYSKQVVHIDAERMIPMQIDYFDRKGEPLKTLTYHGYRLYESRFWRPDRAEMMNHQIGKRTVVEYSNYAFGTGLTDEDLSVDALKRVR